MNGRWLGRALCASLCFLGAAAFAGEPAGQLELATKRVVIFKDGHALVVKEGSGRAGPDGTLTTDQGPTQAVLGTFWIFDLDNSPLASMNVERRSKQERRGSRGTCRSVIEVVKANLGKTARISREKGEELEGKLLRVLESPPAPAGERPEAAAGYYGPWSARPFPAPAMEGDGWRPYEGELFVLRTGQGDVLLAASEVKSLRVPDMAVEVEREEVREVAANRLTLRFADGKPDKAHNVRLLYFRPGLRWVPAYRIGLGDGAQAEIALQAEVLNEAEDIRGAPVDFVVGMPTFRYKDTVSPLVLERALRRVLEEVAPALDNQLMGQQAFSNVYQGRSRRLAPSPAGEAIDFDLAEKAMGANEVQDLFFYSTPALTLPRGQRAAVSLFKAQVPVRHVYTWEPRLPYGVQAARAGGSPLRTERNEVWHQIALQNRTPVPWTTGPAMVLDQGRPVGQDLLTFTPPNAEVFLPVTAAVSVRGTVDEIEEGRERRAEKWQGSYFSRLTNRATFKVTNALKAPIHLVLKAGVGGRAIKATKPGQIAVRGHDPSDGVEGLNPHSEVTFALDLRPGEEREVQLTYLLFVSE